MLIDLRPKICGLPFYFWRGRRKQQFPLKNRTFLVLEVCGGSEAAGENGYLFHLPSILSFLFLEEGEMAFCMPLNGGRGGGGQYRWSNRSGEATWPGEKKRFFFFSRVLRFPTCGEKKSFPLKKKERNGWDRGLNVSPLQMTRTKAMWWSFGVFGFLLLLLSSSFCPDRFWGLWEFKVRHEGNWNFKDGEEGGTIDVKTSISKTFSFYSSKVL